MLALTGATALAQNVETRNVKNFNSLKIQSGIQVIYTHDDTESVRVVSTDKENLDYVVTERSGKLLKVYIDKEENETTSKITENIKVYISDNNISDITVTSGAIVKITNQINTPELTVTLRTGGSLTGNINTTKKCHVKASSGAGFKGSIITEVLNTDITGGAYVKLYGNTETANIFCSGGTLIADKFTSRNADVWARRMSSVIIYVKDSITTDVDNSSAITYYGKPNKIKLGDDTFAVRRK
ncbi:MAG: hypothetical protein BM557_10035 [Flavobacterium sp. MedPE-SWcel]|nr:MAG: hypothetical protein BM557_10035 [Flavobacterium sp. MedPE-SWcel]